MTMSPASQAHKYRVTHGLRQTYHGKTGATLLIPSPPTVDCTPPPPQHVDSSSRVCRRLKAERNHLVFVWGGDCVGDCVNFSEAVFPLIAKNNVRHLRSPSVLNTRGRPGVTPL